MRKEEAVLWFSIFSMASDKSLSNPAVAVVRAKKCVDGIYRVMKLPEEGFAEVEFEFEPEVKPTRKKRGRTLEAGSH